MPIGSLSSCYHLRLSVPLRLNLNLPCSKNFTLHRLSHTPFPLSSMAFPPRLDNSAQQTEVPCLLPGTMLFLCSSPQEGLQAVTYFQLCFPSFFKCKSYFLRIQYMSTVFTFPSFPLLFSSPTVLALWPRNFSNSRRLQLLCVYTYNLVSLLSVPVWRVCFGLTAWDWLS